MAALGIPVMPVHRITWHDGSPVCTCKAGAACEHPGKHPRFSWKHSPGNLPSTDPDKIASWWASTPWNLGALVPAGWLVVDTDARNGGPELLEELAAGQELATWTDYNGTDSGRHYWLRLPDDHPGTGPAKISRDGREVDLLWPGRSAILPPSPHKAGGNRTWLTPVGGGAALEAPSWLLAIIEDEDRRHPSGAGTLPAEAAALLAEHGAREYDAQAIVSACYGEWQRGGLEALIRCPAHDDRHPSAKLTIGDGGRLLWKCYAGCTQAELTKAIRAIPGALLPRPGGTKPARDRQEQPRGVAYKHRPELREVFVQAIAGADPSLLPANPPGSDYAIGFGAVYGPEERPRLWAKAVEECSLYSRGARADCVPGAGREYFAGLMRCKFKLCPTCSGSRMITKAHAHDAAWKAAGVEVFDVWGLEAAYGAPHEALKAANAAFTRWRTRGGGKAIEGMTAVRGGRIQGLGVVPVFLVAVPAGTDVTGWTAGRAARQAAGVGFDEVHELQLQAWGLTLGNVIDTPTLETLLAFYGRGSRILEMYGAPRGVANKAKKVEAAAEALEAEEAGVSVQTLRKARRQPQGEPCPFGCGGRHPLTGRRYLYSDGHLEEGVWVFNRPPAAPPLAEPAVQAAPPPRQLVGAF